MTTFNQGTKTRIATAEFEAENAPALEARLAKTLVQALAQRTARDLGVKLAAQPGVAVPLECCIWPPAAGEEVRGN